MTMTINDADRKVIQENPPAVTDAELIARATKKWSACATDSPGKIQVNRLNKAWSDLHRRAEYIDTGTGMLTSGPIVMLSGMARSFYSVPALTAMAEIGEKFGWTVSAENAKHICAEVAARMDGAEYARVIDRLETDDEYNLRLEREERRAERIRQEELDRAKFAPVEAALLAKRPPNGVALIVATHDVNTSDSMQNYFAHTRDRQIALAWRTGQRDDFRQFRRAAAMQPETAHLGPDADDRQGFYDIEQRRTRSGSIFVKAGGEDSTGWRIESVSIKADGTGFEYGLLREIEDRLPEAIEPEAPGAEVAVGDRFKIVEQFHAKRGIAIWTVIPMERTDTETYRRNNAAAKRLGGWYYREYQGNAGGFHFPNPEDAATFAARMEF